MKCRQTYLAAIMMLLGHATQAQQPFELDTSFEVGIDEWYVSSVAPLDGGDILLSGQIKFPGDAFYRAVARVDLNGDPDPDFPGFVPGGGVLKYWSGRYYAGNNAIVRRIWPDGSIDSDFILMTSDPYFSPLQGGDYHVYPDGRILMSGTHVLSDTVRGFTGLYDLIWFTNTGYLDTTRIHRKGDGIVYEIEEQPDGKFLCTGSLTTWEGIPVPSTIRVHQDGTLDTSFQCAMTWGQFNKFTTLSDGTIIASGLVKSDANSPDSMHIVRMMPDGSLDPTFNNDLITSNDQFGQFLVLHHTVLADGRIVLHGNFELVDGQARGGIALLDPDGNLLSDAFTGDGCGPVTIGQFTYQGTRGMEVAQDGSWYIYGAYHGYDDGTTNDPGQRMVSRLYGLDVGVAEHQPAPAAHLCIHPNPVAPGGTVTVELTSVGVADLAPVDLVVQDVLGRTVRREKMVRTDDVVRIAFSPSSPLSPLVPGTYLLQVQEGNLILASGRLVVE